MTVLQTAVVLAMLGGTPDGVILEFSSRSCGPCQAMAPAVHRLQQQGYAIRSVDIDRERALAQRFRIERVPTTVLIVGGRERQRYVGYLGEDQLRRMARSIPVSGKPARRVATERPSAPEPPTAIVKPVVFTPSGPAVPSVIRANIGEAPQRTVNDDPLAVCVRIRVRDSRGLDVGSGTMIDSRPGRTLILTCGHIFRHYDASGRIEVDLFENGSTQTYDGKLIDHDLKSDVGLISIPTLQAQPCAKLSAHPAAAGQHVFSVGCGGGDPPTRLQHLVTSTTRYKAGFIECTGTPNQGRSGGGLFSTDGEVLGVCVLADPKARRGLYAGLPAVRALLNRAGPPRLVVADTQMAQSDAAAASSSTSDLSDVPPFEVPPAEVPPTAEPNFESQLPRAEIPAAAPQWTTPPRPAQKSRDPSKLHSGLADNNVPPERALSASDLRQQLAAARGAEVVCIIRDRDKPDAQSRVIIIHEASDRFIADLTGELQPRIRPTPDIQPTSLKLPLPLPEPATDQTVRRPASPPVPGTPVMERYRRRR